MSRLAVPFTLCTLWLMIAWAIDKFWFAVLCSQCSAPFAFEFNLQARDLLAIHTDRISAVFLFIVPFLVYGLLLIPYRSLRPRADWIEAIRRWSRPFFWLALVFFWVWLSESLYALLAPALPAWLTSQAEAYRMSISGTLPGLREVTVSGKPGGLFGLLLGLYLFLDRGLAGRRA